MIDRDIKKLIYDDINKNFNLVESEMLGYFFYSFVNLHWVYNPIIIRSESESIVHAWSFYVNGAGRIISSFVYEWGETKISDWKKALYAPKDSDQQDIKKVEKLLNDNYLHFQDDICMQPVAEIIQKYSVEIIKQNKNFRIRLREKFKETINYDFYWDSAQNKITFNVINPIGQGSDLF